MYFMVTSWLLLAMGKGLKKVRFGNLTANLSQFKSGQHSGKWRIRYKDRDGKWRVGGVFKDLKKAEKVAVDILEEIFDGNSAENSLTQEELAMLIDLRKSDVSCEEVLSFVRLRRGAVRVVLYEAIDQYLETFVEGRNYSSSHKNDIVYGLNLIRDCLGEKEVRDVVVTDIERVLADTGSSFKRQNNLRGVMNSFWKWAIKRDMSVNNPAEDVTRHRIKKVSGGHGVFMPRQFAIMLSSCPEADLPWLAISGFAGLRHDEIVGRTRDRESALRWEDFHFEREKPVIVVRSETSKTNTPRIVPICESLMAWLEPWKNKTGLVHPHARPSSTRDPVTKRLGALVGGWVDNGLRSSRASYRLAQTGRLSLTASEMGHTEKMLRENYLNPRFEEDADLWFSLSPQGVKALLSHPQVIEIKKASQA